MQLLNSLPNQLDTITDDELLSAALCDIVNSIEIPSHFCIRHPDYKPLELPAEAAERFEQLPLNLRNKYLSTQMQVFLYGIYYNSSLKAALAPDADWDDRKLHQNLENNTFLGIDLGFYERLHQSNSGEGYYDKNWQVVRHESDGSLAVTKDGLTLHIDRDRHLQPGVAAAIGDTVAIRLPKNRVQNGFYMAISNAASHRSNGNIQPQTVRVYFNLTSEGAVSVMHSLTSGLNDINIPFSFKVLYNPSDYKRYDSGVLYFDKSNYEAVKSVLQRVYAKERSHFQAEIPLFTKLLAPGLGLAEEPDRKFSDQESFGMNRCQIIANGLLEAWHNGENSPDNRMAAILQQFTSMGIDLNRCYLNANSEDIYTPLNP